MTKIFMFSTLSIVNLGFVTYNMTIIILIQNPEKARVF